MPSYKPGASERIIKQKLTEAFGALDALGFSGRQKNETAAYTLLAMLDLKADIPWSKAQAPLRGITPIIQFIATAYGVKYAPNTRETIRDDAVKFFVEAGLLLRNPDNLGRPTNSGKTVYQIEPTALAMLRKIGSPRWAPSLKNYLVSRQTIKNEIVRKRILARVPVTLPDGSKVALSPGGQNPLIKSVIEHFCPIFAPGGVVVYIGDTESKFVHLETNHLASLGIRLNSAAKMPDVVVHYVAKNWLLLIEAVTTAGPVDGKRRKELKELFSGCKAGLVFVTAFPTRRIMQSYASQIAWESEVWIAEDPEHLVHFNGERFLGPYPDVTPK